MLKEITNIIKNNIDIQDDRVEDSYFSAYVDFYHIISLLHPMTTRKYTKEYLTFLIRKFLETTSYIFFRYNNGDTYYLDNVDQYEKDFLEEMNKMKDENFNDFITGLIIPVTDDLIERLTFDYCSILYIAKKMGITEEDIKNVVVTSKN